MKKRILVTGASGLVGYEICRFLHENDCNVTALYYMRRECIGDNVLSYNLFKRNLEDLHLDVDCIIHCAALIPKKDNCDEYVASINRVIDDNVINYSIKHQTRLIYISSTSIYGCRNETISENMSPIISSSYSREKLRSEQLIATSLDNYCIMRISSPYGYRQECQNVLKIFVDTASKGENLYYFGTGQRTQNFTDARDIAHAVTKAIDIQGGVLLNIASNESIQMKDLAYLVRDIAKKVLNSETKVFMSGLRDAQEDIRINIDISKAIYYLNWKPMINIESGITNWMRILGEDYDKN